MQTVKNAVEVYCRIRPSSATNQMGASCIITHTPTKLQLIPFEDHKNKFKYQYSFTFKRIFQENAQQHEIFEEIALPLLRKLLRGENGLLFSYGVTCSGKTYTMYGEHTKPGLVPRTIQTLFNTIHGQQTNRFLIKSDQMNGFEIQTEEEALKEVQNRNEEKTKLDFIDCCGKLHENIYGLIFTVFITYVEIYNNNVYDLLEETTSLQFLQNRLLREDCNKNIYVNNVNEVEVKCASEALHYYSLGNKRKKTAQTALNNESSRSHSIFTIRLIIKDTSNQDEIKISQLSLVDLAGSERCNRTHSSGIRLKEASAINNSLMSLRLCLELLRENELKGTRKLIPYRDSRLTHLFKNYFEGHGTVRMVICVNPSIQDHEENFHVLKFAEMTQEVYITTTCNKKLPVIPEIDHEPLKITLNPEDNQIKPIISHLKRRKDRLTKRHVIQTKSTTFRCHLFDVQKNTHILQTHVQHYLPAEKQKLEMMKEKFCEIELKYDHIIEKCEEKENTISELNKCLQEKQVKLNEALMEKHKQGLKLDELTNKLKHELDIKLQHQKEYLEAQMKENASKLDLVKGILTESSQSNVIKLEQTYSPTPTPTNTITSTTISKTLIPRMPVSNIRYNKSCVKSAKWLEHKPALPTHLKTVLQPKMKRKKCVTSSSICKEDVVNSKRNKYVLINQNKDEDGDLETELFKGDIIATCSGGAQVILNDVEKVTQESPLQQNHKYY